MNVTDISNVLSSIDSALNKRNGLATNIEKSFRNKKMAFYRFFFLYLYILAVTPLTILVLFNNNYLENFITNNVWLEIVKTIITLFDAFPISFLVIRLIGVDRYFSCEEFRKAKKEIYDKDSQFIYLKTKKTHRKFKLQRIGAYCIENLLPLLIITLITFLMCEYSLHNLIASIVMIVMMSYILAIHYEKNYSIKFYISEVQTTLNKEQLVGREIIRIDGQNFYISNKECNAYYYDGKYLLLKYKASNFEGQDIILFLVYLNEYIELLKEFKKDDMCKNKQELSNIIKSFEDISKTLSELT